METHQLLFELSHPVRYEIMQHLADYPMRLTKIGERVEANNPEVSRHLDRLKNSGLIEKLPEGRYGITPLGQIVLTSLSGISFVANHTDFFYNHDTSILPQQFKHRIGELLHGKQEEGTFTSIQHGLRIAQEAEKKILLFTREANQEFRKIINQRITHGIRFRAIAEMGFSFQPNDSVPPLPEYRKNTRIVDQIPLMFISSEKEAGINFPDRKGIFHFSSTFFSGESSFLGWCEDIFEYYWKSSAPLSNDEDQGTGDEV